MAQISALNPRLVVSDAAGAIAFYVAAFDAQETERHTDERGKIVHAEVTVGPARLAIKDEDDGDPSPSTLGGTPVIIAIVVESADAVAEAMLAHGGSVVFPIHDTEYGIRGGRLADPYGHHWMIHQKAS
ncbi:MAG TPA: VOC family protein [Micromonosporaceae bacterium]|jgi:uncharacterized glyoxalase superfamily protein PhnB